MTCGLCSLPMVDHVSDDGATGSCRRAAERTLSLREAVNALADILDCTRHDAVSLIYKARREGYRVAN